MISPEQLVTDLNKEIDRLTTELAEAQQDIKDFEHLAIEWRKGHVELEIKHRREIGNLKETIKELEKEINELKGRDFFGTRPADEN